MRNLLRELEANVGRLQALLQDDVERADRRDGDWTLLDVLSHLRSREQLFGERIRSFGEGATDLPTWDVQADLERERAMERTTDEIVAELAQLRERNLRQLRDMSSAVLAREAAHEVLGAYSLRDEVGRVAAHDAEHLAQIQALLAR